MRRDFLHQSRGETGSQMRSVRGLSCVQGLSSRQAGSHLKTIATYICTHLLPRLFIVVTKTLFCIMLTLITLYYSSTTYIQVTAQNNNTLILSVMRVEIFTEILHHFPIFF